MGRPSKLTDEVRSQVIIMIGEGNYRSAVASAVGVDRSTFKRWMSEDAAFRAAVMKAEGEAEFTALRHVMSAAAADPVHARWFLERKFPQRWGADRIKKAAEVEAIRAGNLIGDDGGDIQLVVKVSRKSDGKEAEASAHGDPAVDADRTPD